MTKVLRWEGQLFHPPTEGLLRVSSVLSTLPQDTHSALQSELVSSTTVYVTKSCK